MSKCQLQKKNKVDDSEAYKFPVQVPFMKILNPTLSLPPESHIPRPTSPNPTHIFFKKGEGDRTPALGEDVCLLKGATGATIRYKRYISRYIGDMGVK